MKIVVKKNLGNAILEVICEGKDEKETIAKATFFTQPDYCGLCKGTNIVWASNKAKTKDGMFTYIKRKCLKCGAESTAGEYKEGGLFWKEWSIYKKDDGENKEEIPVINKDENEGNEEQNIGDFDKPF